MNVQIYHSPQRSPPLENYLMRVKIGGSGFRHHRPEIKKAAPCLNISKIIKR